jgi:hypothetical protein
VYSEVRDKQGVAAQEAWKGVDLSALVATERANLKRLLDAELDMQDQLAASIRDHELRAIVEAGTLKEGLVDRVQQRLGDVAGDGASVAASRSRLAAFRKRTLQLGVLADEFETKRLAIPTCDGLAHGATPPTIEQWRKTAKELDRAEIDATVSKMREVCAREENDIVRSVYAGLGGDVQRSLNEYYDAARRLEEVQKDADGLRLDYEAARGEYERALAESTSLSSAAERVGTALDKLNKAVSALDAAQDALSAQFLSNERIDFLDAFVQAVTEAKADGSVPERASKATVAFILLPGLIDDARVPGPGAQAPRPAVAHSTQPRTAEAGSCHAGDRGPTSDSQAIEGNRRGRL